MATRVEAVREGRAGGERRDAALPTAALSIVIPTRNEVDNIDELVARLELVLPETEKQVVFVDDSDDGTPAAIERVSATSALDIELLHRPVGERIGGLGGAVVAGVGGGRAPWGGGVGADLPHPPEGVESKGARAPGVCVMAADLQPPPEVIESMVARALDRRTDLVVASRFCENGSVGSFGPLRRYASRVSTKAAGVFFRGSLRSVTDPMSGF